MESVYHIVAIRVNETSWAHLWRLRSLYLRTGYESFHYVNRRVESELSENFQDIDFEDLEQQQTGFEG
jgi:hypothetical protein